MYSSIQTSALLGVEALPVRVEVDISTGLPGFTMVGSLCQEVRESKDRIQAAMKNCGLELPASKITVNLSPADIHKDGTAYDLPILIGILSCLSFFPQEATEGVLFLGELGLGGEVKSVRGVLPIVRKARDWGISTCIVPGANEREAAVVPGIRIRSATHIRQVLEYLQTGAEDALPAAKPVSDEEACAPVSVPDFAEVCGQENAKRAAIISAAGFHSLLMTGPPGVGKSLIAKRIPGILPPLNLEESLEVTSVHSVAGLLPPGVPLIRNRIFQAPHHSLSLPALIGGGVSPRPGAISLAHRSVLFLDELPEFQRNTLDSLRQPLEDHRIHIARARYSITYPADFLLICAMNPCPCGYYPDRNKCRCSETQIRHYLGKVSGPILDRIDLCVELKGVDLRDIRKPAEGLSSAEMRSAVERARSMQRERYAGTGIRFNSDLSPGEIERFCGLGPGEQAYLESVYDKIGLSARSYHRVLRVARTIADLEGSEAIARNHLLEAIYYRPDLSYWKG
ncbi:MAG: YifB family Mg chelatase-like AAA ATPase [Lachnospiraceae bacterium]|nr:YifB family Mg chelatase-like AAA ATPase [Lachnospiraceae bacterium]